VAIGGLPVSNVPNKSDNQEQNATADSAEMQDSAVVLFYKDS
jgi:hypothetical protein